MRELIVDSFAGGGGASTGIEMALGRSPDIAINHDDVALSMHAVNHPATVHLPHNVWKVDPHAVCKGHPVGLLWASPDCKHFSKAKGGRPVQKNIRDLAWVVVRWAKQVAPRVIILENVEEFASWGPLGADDRPCPKRAGQTFKKWVGELRRLGYKVDWRELCAADYGAPTTRKRLFLIARRDGLPVIWPKPTHGRPASLGVTSGKLKPWRTAAEIIDWSLPCPSIFDTSKQIKAAYGFRAIRPLARNTLARVARGVGRYVLEHDDPFIVPITHTGDARVHGLDEPVRTLTTAHRGEHAVVMPFVTKFNTGSTGHDAREPLHTITSAHSETHPGGAAPMGLVAPTLIQTGYGERPGQAPRVPGLDKPLGTCVDGQKHAVVSAFLAQHNTDMVGHDAREAVSTIVQKGCTQAVVEASLISNFYTSNTRGGDGDQREPLNTVTAGGLHAAEVRAFLTKYYGTDQDPRLEEPMHTVLPPLTPAQYKRAKQVAAFLRKFGVWNGGEIVITKHGHVIVDIGMRMLTPRELFRAQGFPNTYKIDVTPQGHPITKTDQIQKCGNSVCPDVAAALVAANYEQMTVAESGVPEFALVAAE